MAIAPSSVACFGREAAAELAERRANGRDDDGAGHGGNLSATHVLIQIPRSGMLDQQPAETGADAESVSRLRLVLAGALGALIVVGRSGGRKARAGRQRQPALSPADAALERGLVAEINAFRARNGLRPLVVSPALERRPRATRSTWRARAHFAHESSNGDAVHAARAPLLHARPATARGGPVRRCSGPRPTSTPSGPLTMWLESPGAPPRASSTSAWREIGLSAVHTPSGPTDVRQPRGHGRDRRLRRPV